MRYNNQNRFINMTENRASLLATEFASPLFIMDESGIIQRFHALKNAVQQRYSHSLISVSYKTNYLKGLLALLHHEGAHAEVVSGTEYSIATQIRQPGQKIIFNGPMKTEDELIRAINDESIINCDNEDEIHRIAEIAEKIQRRVSIGMRIHFSNSAFTWNRFGFKVPGLDTMEIIKNITTSPYLKLAGLHAHIGTNIRDMNYFSKLSSCMNNFAIELKNNFQIELEWIDLGGGLAGISPLLSENKIEPHPLPDVNLYANAIIKPLLPYLNSLKKPALLIFEPGRTLFEAYGALLTRVAGLRKEEDDYAAVICDAGINSLATSHTYDFPLKVFSNASPYKKTKIYGPTCNQIDQLHTPALLPSLKLNDLLLFYGVGSYCMAFSYSFIRFRPGVVLWRSDNSAAWLRKPETLDHNALLENIPPFDNASAQV